MSKMLVGIDVSLRSHHVQCMDEAGRSLASFSVSNDQNGADTLIKRMLETSEKVNSHILQIGMEATSNLGWHLAHYLKDQLQGYEPKLKAQIYVLNARKVARFPNFNSYTTKKDA